jgi:transposase
MARGSRYQQELRERAVRMVFDHQDEHASEWAAITSIVGRLGCPRRSRKWVRRAEIDEGFRPVLTTYERERLKALKRENRERRRANGILKSAAAFFRRTSTADRADGSRWTCWPERTRWPFAGSDDARRIARDATQNSTRNPTVRQAARQPFWPGSAARRARQV